MGKRKHVGASWTRIAAIALGCMLIASGALVAQERNPVVVAFDVRLADGDAENLATVYIQRVGSYDFNIDVKNLTSGTNDNLEIVLEGIHNVEKTYDGYGPPFGPRFTHRDITKDVGRGETVITWSGTEVAPGEEVHVGVRTESGDAKIKAIYWTRGIEPAGVLPHFGFSLENDFLILWNPGESPIVIDNFRIGDLLDGWPLELSQLNAVALEQNGIEMIPIDLAGLELGSGERADTSIEMPEPRVPVPAASLWGLAFLALVPPAGYALLRVRRSRIR